MSEADPPKVPRALMFAVLAILWIFPSLGAGFILARAENGWQLEQWLALMLLAIHAVFIYVGFAGGGFSMLRRGLKRQA